MLNLKNIAIMFVSGFVLSLLAGIFGRVSFGILLLRAMLSGGLFIGFGFGVKFVYTKFLLVSESEVEISQDTESHKIDIVIDEELPDSATAPSFDIGNSSSVSVPRQKESVTIHEEPVVSSIVEEVPSFQQSSLDSMTATTLDTEAPLVESAPIKHFDGNLDEMLPNLDVLDLRDDDDDGAFESEVDEAPLNVTMSTATRASTTSSDIGDDPEAIAAAIRTVLVKDI